MAYEPAKWAPGLLFIGTLWVLGSLGETGTVERDLMERAKAALGADVLDKPDLSVAGRDVTVSGAAFTQDGANSVFDTVLGVNGVRLVNADGVALVAEAKPYVWSASKDGAKIALAGSVPDPAARAAVNAAAKSIAGAAISDGMDYKRGDAAALGPRAAFALGELARFSKGSATLTDGSLALTGVALDTKNFEAALAALKTPPSGVTISKADIAAPLAKPFVFSAANGPGGLTLSGSAPSLEARDAIAAAAAKLFPGAKIDNALAVASGAPKGDFNAVALFALSAISKLDAGKAVLTDTQLAISGKARDLGGLEALDKSVGGLGSGFALSSEVAPADAHPYVFDAVKGADGIRITGYAPSLEIRKSLEAAAAASGKSVSDETVLAAGVPSGVDFGATAAFALAELAKFSSGEAKISDTDLSITGVSMDANARQDAEAALKALPAGIRLATGQIEKSAEEKAADAAAAAAKKAAEEAAAKKAAEEAAAKKAAEEAAAKKAAEEAAAKKAAEEAAAKKAAEQAAAKKAAEEAAAKKAADEAAAQKAAEDAAAKRAAAPSSLEDVATAAAAIAAQGPKLDVAACDQGLKAELASGTVEFDSGKATISNKSYAMIVKLASVALRCEVASISVTGHTDSQGDAKLNQTLSKARADAVVAILAKAGVPGDKMQSEGFGADKPIASNDTEEGRAKNRRIEFEVK